MRQRAPRGVRGACQIAAAIQREPELVLHARRAIVEREVGAIRSHGAGGVATGQPHVAGEFERLRGRRVERLRLGEVALRPTRTGPGAGRCRRV